MDTERIRKAVRKNFPDIEIVTHSEDDLQALRDIPVGEKTGAYLRSCLPNLVYLASGVRVLTLESILSEVFELAPGALVAPHGYLPVASTIGGNVLVVAKEGDIVYFADRSWFFEKYMRYKDAVSGKWPELPYSSENIRKALVHLSDDLEEFLVELIRGEWEERLDALD